MTFLKVMLALVLIIGAACIGFLLLPSIFHWDDRKAFGQNPADQFNNPQMNQQFDQGGQNQQFNQGQDQFGGQNQQYGGQNQFGGGGYNQQYGGGGYNQQQYGQQSMGGFGINQIVGMLISAGGGAAGGKYAADRRTKALEELHRESLAAELKTKEQLKELARVTYTMNADKAAIISDAPAVQLEALNEDVNQFREKVAKA